MGSIDDARAILSSMMGAVATVLALIFSVALLLLSMVSTLFSPRLLYRFLQDWVTQTTIGLFMGTFVYICLVFLVTHQDPRSSLIPQISLITCWVLVMFSFRFLVYYCHRVARSIQNPDMDRRNRRRFVLRAAPGSAHLTGPGEDTGAVPPFWLRSIAATWMRLGAGHKPRSKRVPERLTAVLQFRELPSQAFRSRAVQGWHRWPFSIGGV
jgi:hypothetical protein